MNDPKLIPKTYQRYLLGKFRDDLTFDEVPIKLYLRRRHPADLRDEVTQGAAGAAGKHSSEVESERRPADAKVR